MGPWRDSSEAQHVAVVVLVQGHRGGPWGGEGDDVAGSKE